MQRIQLVNIVMGQVKKSELTQPLKVLDGINLVVTEVQMFHSGKQLLEMGRKKKKKKKKKKNEREWIYGSEISCDCCFGNKRNH